MANETERANIIGPTDVLADGIAAALVQKVVCVPQIRSQDLPVGTHIKRFNQQGSLTATAGISESATYSFSASSEYTETNVVDLAAQKTGIVSKVTVEAIQFKNFGPGDLARLQGEAIARALDDNVLALNSGFSGGVTSSAGAVPEDFLQGVYVVNSGLAGKVGGNLKAFIDYKAHFEMMKYLMQSGASAYTVPSNLSLLGGTIPNTGYVGSIPGLDFFVTDGLPTSGSDDVALVFNDEMAHAAMFGSSVQTEVVWVGSGGFYWEISSWIFEKVAEWIDAAGCKVLSDT